MDDEIYKKSRFWKWHIDHSHAEIERQIALGAEALKLVVASVQTGEITSLDSVDSPLSNQIRAHHGVTEFEMNSNWIGSDQDWICPCCTRSKFQISRIGKKGQLLAKLVVHHDHMGEVLESAFHRAFDQQNTTNAQEEGLRLVSRIGRAFSAYDEVLICEDCNHADVEAKKIAGAPKYFSFSIGQMRQFILAGNHRPHQIDSAIAIEVWSKAVPAYDLRMRLIAEVARAAATDSHWYESFPKGMNPVPTIQSHGYRQGDIEIKQWVYVEPLIRELGPKEKLSTPNFARWRTGKWKGGRPLPENFLAMLRSDPFDARLWDTTDALWACPICKRSKTEILYVGDKGKVHFAIPETDGRGNWASAPRICGHCKTVLIGLKHEIEHRIGARLESSYTFLAPNELVEMIIPHRHASHEIDPVKAEQLAAQLENRCKSHL